MSVLGWIHIIGCTQLPAEIDPDDIATQGIQEALMEIDESNIIYEIVENHIPPSCSENEQQKIDSQEKCKEKPDNNVDTGR